MSRKYTFLLIGGEIDAQWLLVLQQALSSLGELRIISEEQTVQEIIQRHYDVIIINARAIPDVASLLSRLRVQQPRARIVVATASPTWQGAREMLKAGAADYIYKSLDKKELRSKIQAVLKAPPPPWPY